MITDLFLKGSLIGFSIAMPVGPIGLLCIRNSLDRGMFYGLATGLGAACADALFGAIAGFGVTAIGNFLTSYQSHFQLFAGAFLCSLGIMTCKKSPQESGMAPPSSNRYAFFSTFLLTLSNPMTILSFAGIYMALGSESLMQDSFLLPFILTLGVLIGSAAWWLFLSSSASFFKEKINFQTKKWLNRISGTIIFGFGLYTFLKLGLQD